MSRTRSTPPIHVVVYGSHSEGFRLIGPFDDPMQGGAWAREHLEGRDVATNWCAGFVWTPNEFLKRILKP